MSIKRFYKRSFIEWLNRRLPASSKVQLDQAKLFIFPSKIGFGFLGLLVLLWLLATNYENNLVFAITFLLTSLFITTILHSFANLAGLEVSFVSAEPVFAGGEALFEIVLSRSDKRTRHNLQLCFADRELETAELVNNREQRVRVPASSVRRGWFNPGRVTVQSYYPLGLLRVWTHLDLDCRALVYPKPVFAEPSQASLAEGGEEGQLQASVGSDDFAGFKEYATGEPLQHVAWKHYARERGLHSKQFADTVDERLWVDWNSYPGLDREARLSRLCGRLMTLAKGNAEYGLRLPGVEVPLGRGEAHSKQLLRELALFETKEFETEGLKTADPESISRGTAS